MRYAELHCKTNFSFLEGASFADELVEQAAFLKLEALGVTDRNSLCGIVRAHTAAKEAKLKLLVGAEINAQSGGETDTLLIYPTDRAAYGRLSRLITVGRRRAEKGECDLTLTDVAEHSAGQIAIVVPPSDIAALKKWASDSHTVIREAFGKRLNIALDTKFPKH